MVLDKRDALRVLLMGTGSIGRRHLDNLRKLEPSATLAFLRDGAREDDLSRQHTAEVFGDIDEAIAWNPHIAIIATPSDRHFETLPALLEARVATLIEKPIVIDADQLDRLAALSPGRLPPTQVGCVLRFLEPVATLRSWIDQGRLGNLIRARIECGQYLPEWRPGTDFRQSYSAHRVHGGGVLFDLIHEIDLAVFLFGAERLDYAIAAKRSSLPIQSDDVASLHVSGSDGVPVAIGLDYVARDRVRNVEVVGEDGSARLDLVAGSLTLTREGGLKERITTGFDIDAAFVEELAELIRAQRGGGATQLPLHEGLRANRLAIQADMQAGHRNYAA